MHRIHAQIPGFAVRERTPSNIDVGLAAAGERKSRLQPAEEHEKLVPFSANLNSPDVADDGTVTFRLRAPAAKEVLLSRVAVLTALKSSGRGVPFAKGEDGVWSLKVGPLKPDMYAYHLVVDGVRIADPNNTVAAFTAMPPYGDLIVHGSGPAYYDARNVPHGQSLGTSTIPM
jgi:enterochelin esterase family protein